MDEARDIKGLLKSWHPGLETFEFNPLLTELKLLLLLSQNSDFGTVASSPLLVE